MASCPFTHGVIYSGGLPGELIEADGEKNDNIYELKETLTYVIYYEDYKAHTKKPLSGVAVTIKKPNNVIVNTSTDSNGGVKIVPEFIGQWALAYYDPYTKRAKLVNFMVVKELKPVNLPPIVTPPVVAPPIIPPVVTPKPPVVSPTGTSLPEPIVVPSPKNVLLELFLSFLALFRRKK